MSEPQTLVVLAETASKEDTTDDAPTAETPPVLRRKGSSANANDPENLEVAEPVPVVAEAFATTPTSVIATNTQTTENATNSTTEESSISVPPIATTAPPWELIPYESWSMLSSIADVGWKANYLLLAQFRKEHGHLHVSDALNAPLAVWMRRQQQMYGDFYSQFEGRCTQRKTSEEMRHMFTKIEMLRAMGVVFAGMQRQFVDPQGPEKMPRSPPVDIIKYVSSGQSTKRKIDWETNLDNLREFRDQHGHCDAEDINLNRWVYRQRKRLRGENGARAAPLTEDEIRRLRDVGVLTLTKKKLKRLARSDGIAPPGVSNESVPKNLSNPERFDEMYEKMKEFYERHGHTVVPEKKDMKLRGFLVDVRNEYKKIKEGGVSAYLTPIRIERLKQINFSFEARPRHTFDERVEQWLEYRKQSGGKNPRSKSFDSVASAIKFKDPSFH